MAIVLWLIAIWLAWCFGSALVLWVIDWLPLGGELAASVAVTGVISRRETRRPGGKRAGRGKPTERHDMQGPDESPRQHVADEPLATVHNQIRAIASEHGVTTDLVMLAIGIEEQDLSVVLDPRIGERVRAMKLEAPLETVIAVRRAVRVFLNGLADLGIDRRGEDLPDDVTAED